MAKTLILSIDDNPDFNTILKAILRKNGYRAISTTNPKSFFKKFNDKKPDLCLIDLNLDDLTGGGFQLIQAIRNKKGFDIPLLVLSRRSDTQDIAYALQMGATDYIQKPIDEPTLLAKIQYALKLYNEDNSNFNFNKIGEERGECTIELDLTLHSINEIGIVIETEHLISKGTQLNIKNKFLNELLNLNMDYIPFYVSNTSIKEGTCYITLDFDSDNAELMGKVRRWLLEKQSLQET